MTLAVRSAEAVKEGLPVPIRSGLPATSTGTIDTIVESEIAVDRELVAFDSG
jgi:hypothetical protein